MLCDAFLPNLKGVIEKIFSLLRSQVCPHFALAPGPPKAFGGPADEPIRFRNIVKWLQEDFNHELKHKSGVGTTIDYSRDYTVVNDV